MAPQILADAGFTDVDAQLEQLAVNARCSPQRIFATQSADKFSNVFGKRRPPRSIVSDLPGPEQTKALAVPSDDGVRIDDTRADRQLRARMPAAGSFLPVPRRYGANPQRRSEPRASRGVHRRAKRPACGDNSVPGLTDDAHELPRLRIARALRNVQGGVTAPPTFRLSYFGGGIRIALGRTNGPSLSLDGSPRTGNPEREIASPRKRLEFCVPLILDEPKRRGYGG